MSQCVPSWDIDETPLTERLSLHSNPSSTELVTSSGNPTLDYEVAELTWENGQLAMHGLGLPRLATGKSAVSKYTWEKPRASGTLESIVNQATQSTPPCKSDSELLPWFNHHQRNAIPASTTIVMDALVPCTMPTNPNLSTGTCVNGNTTLVESSSAGVPTKFNTRTKDVVEEEIATKRERLGTTREEGSSRIHSVMESRHVGVDMDMDLHLDVGFTSTSLGSQDNTSMSTGKPLRSYTNGNMSYTNGNTFDDHDSLSHSRPQEIGAEEDKKNEKSSVSTKRSRAAAIHNQSERKRRDKINQRMKTLQKLVPNSNKTDKASMLDEVIEYLKQLQAQVQVMSRMSIPPMMIPMNMQQQLQMAMMAQMGMGMSMGMGMGVMDLNSIGRPNIPSIPPIINPAAFMSMASWDGTGDRVAPSATILPDPMANFLACQSQPMNMDAYTKMAALYQQMHQQQFSNSKT